MLFVRDWTEEERRALDSWPVDRENITPLCRPFISFAMKLMLFFLLPPLLCLIMEQFNQVGLENVSAAK